MPKKKPTTKLDKFGREYPTQHPSKDKQMNEYFNQFTPAEVTDFIESVDEVRFQNLLTMMSDPKFARLSLNAMARRCGIALQEFQDAYRRYQLGTGMTMMARHLPGVMNDVAIDARSTWDLCPRCNGDGAMSRGDKLEPCITCEGHGKVRIPGNVDARKMVLEANKVIGQRGPLVDLNFDMRGAGFQKIEDMVRVRERLLEE